MTCNTLCYEDLFMSLVDIMPKENSTSSWSETLIMVTGFNCLVDIMFEVKLILKCRLKMWRMVNRSFF